MEYSRAFALSIAGFDPTGGAGVAADLKTFEAHGIHGLGACTAITFQNDIEFEDLKWISGRDILEQVNVLMRRFDFEWVKIGLIENFDILHKLAKHMKHNRPKIKIIWDPIFKATAGYHFHEKISEKELFDICKYLYLITPNLEEIKKLLPDMEEYEAAQYLSAQCKVLLKGGHTKNLIAKDILFDGEKQYVYETEKLPIHKHGTGCVLSASITACMAKGETIENACKKGKAYIEQYIKSETGLLGMHYA